jgi:hypothetical protein
LFLFIKLLFFKEKICILLGTDKSYLTLGNLETLDSKDRHLIPYAYSELISKIAPNLFKQARFKKRMVATELQDNNWIKNLGEINSTSALEEYILLYSALSTMALTDQRDQIIWRWTSNGKYTAKSAYNCQFAGAMTTFRAKEIWKALSEPKCIFYV